MSVTAAKVKQLRDSSGAGFSLCKEALVNCDGDLEAAAEWIQARGGVLAQKKSGRETSEGRIEFAASGNRGALVEILCETDFVANNEQLRDFANAVAQAAASNGSGDDVPLAQVTHNGKVVEELRQDVSAKTGENVQFGRHKILTAKHSLHHYIHHNVKIGVMADVRCPDESTVGKDICLQVAAMRPEVVSIDDFDKEQIESVRKSFEQEVAESGKDPNVQEKIVSGKVAKYMSERALLKQDFIKEDKVKVGKYLQDNNSEVVDFAALFIA